MAKLRLDITLDEYDMRVAIAQYIVHTYVLQVDDVDEFVKSIDISHITTKNQFDPLSPSYTEYIASCHYEEN